MKISCYNKKNLNWRNLIKYINIKMFVSEIIMS